jgi:transposase
MLTDQQWQLIQPLLPAPPPADRRGRPPLDQRLILDSILWKLITRCSWRQVASPRASHQVCYLYYRTWRDNGLLSKIYDVLMQDLRTRGNFDPGKAALDGLVKVEEKDHKIVFYIRGELVNTWQVATAMLYYQHLAAIMESQMGLANAPDPLLQIFRSPSRAGRSAGSGTPGSS